MDSREQQRAQLVPGLAKLTRSRDFRTALSKATTGDNSMTVIPALPDDTMGYVFDRLADAGGRGVVAMSSSDSFDLAVLWPATQARVTVALEDDQIAPVHRDSHVRMLFQHLHDVRSAVIWEVAVELMPRDDLLPV